MVLRCQSLGSDFWAHSVANTICKVLSDPQKKDAAEERIDYKIIEYTRVYLAFCLNGMDSRRVTDAHLFKVEGCWEIRMRSRRDIAICHEVSGGKRRAGFYFTSRTSLMHKQREPGLKTGKGVWWIYKNLAPSLHPSLQPSILQFKLQAHRISQLLQRYNGIF